MAHFSFSSAQLSLEERYANIAAWLRQQEETKRGSGDVHLQPAEPLAAISIADDAKELKWLGQSQARVVKLFVKDGTVLQTGALVAHVQAEGETTQQQKAVSSYGYETMSLYNPSDSNNDCFYGAAYNDDCFDASNVVGDNNVTEMVWSGPFGVVTEVLVQNDFLLCTGDIVLKVGCQQQQQQAALLKTADAIAFKNQDQRNSLNGRFQCLVEEMIKSISGSKARIAHTMQVCSDLERVARDFEEIARMYGRVIISELHLPFEQKTVRPLDMGGVLGGSKYVVRGVLFKVGASAEMFSCYPDPIRIANKVQGHELKGLMAYFGYLFNRGNMHSVAFPLIAIIDFKGHRITALTALPISGGDSLVYGSADAGKECNVLQKEPVLTSVVKESSLGLNLKVHAVVNGRSAQGEAEVASCVDLEGHRGSDNRFYLIDFSRALPAAYKESSTRQDYDTCWPFYHMLRPEFVSRWSKPLSADAFSNFQSKKNSQRQLEAKKDNQEVRDATDYLKKEVVKRVCSNLASKSEEVSLVHAFHQEGLNMRYLGLVYACLDIKEHARARKLVQVEALSRVFKNYLRSCLRQLHVGLDFESALVKEAAQVLNSLFAGNSSMAHWRLRNPAVEKDLVASFSFSTSDAEEAIDSFLRATNDVMQTISGNAKRVSLKYAILRRLNDCVGLGISSSLLTDLESGASEFNQGRVFKEADFSFEERVKRMDIVDRTRALGFFVAATRKDPPDLSGLLSAYSITERALERSPLEPWLCNMMAETCASLWWALGKPLEERRAAASASASDAQKLKAFADSARTVDAFLERAEKYFKLAISLSNNSAGVPLYRGYGKFLLKQGRLDDAETFLLRSLELCRERNLELDQEALDCLLSLLAKKGNNDTASLLLEKSKSFSKIKRTLGTLDSTPSTQRATRQETLSPNLSSSPSRKINIKAFIPKSIKQIGESIRQRSPRGGGGGGVGGSRNSKGESGNLSRLSEVTEGLRMSNMSMRDTPDSATSSMIEEEEDNEAPADINYMKEHSSFVSSLESSAKKISAPPPKKPLPPTPIAKETHHHHDDSEKELEDAFSELSDDNSSMLMKIQRVAKISGVSDGSFKY